MAASRTLKTRTLWLRLDATESDWASESADDLIAWLEQILLIRRFEETILDLAGQGLVHGPAHASIGQEAGAVAAMSALGMHDRINGTHRAHHQVLAKLVNSATPAGYRALSDAFTPEMQDTV